MTLVETLALIIKTAPEKVSRTHQYNTTNIFDPAIDSMFLVPVYPWNSANKEDITQESSFIANQNIFLNNTTHDIQVTSFKDVDLPMYQSQ